MKASLLKHFFDGNYFMNQVIGAAFRERDEWLMNDLELLVAWVAVKLEAPKMTGTRDQVAGWIRAGLAILVERDGDFFVKPGRTASGNDIRTVGTVRPEISELIKPGIQGIAQHKKALDDLDRRYIAKSPVWAEDR